MCFFFQAEDGIRYLVRSRGLGDVYKRHVAHLIDFDSYFAAELADLRDMEKAGLVRLDSQWITVLPRGRLLVRAIAMLFDRYLRSDRDRVRYSKVI